MGFVERGSEVLSQSREFARAELLAVRTIGVLAAKTPIYWGLVSRDRDTNDSFKR